MTRRPPRSTLFPYTRSSDLQAGHVAATAKHFLGDGGTAQGEDQGDDQINEEELIARHAQGYPAAKKCFADRKSTRLNSSHVSISYAVFCLKKKHNVRPAVRT